MNFTEFQQSREQLLADRGSTLLDCSGTNLYAALNHLIPAESAGPTHTVHRCHLASEWCAHFGLTPETSRRALISCGVRDSLARLFSHYSAAGTVSLWLPADNYPVYHELAREAGLSPHEFQTLPQPVWPSSSSDPAAEAEVILVTNPMKPLGRYLNSDDISTLTAWLRASRQRRLILDAVYTFECQFHPSTLQLMETGQVILLHSLTKGWLQPRLFGVTLVLPDDAKSLTEAFRLQPPSQHKLARAREMLAGHTGMPSLVAREIAAARDRMRTALRESFALPASSSPESSSYFIPVQANWRDLLDSNNILGIPASAFGSGHRDITILSCVSFME
ncbi:MAG: aminotransferase class I/II-fold pyridoxal phosphate-dependent enzyme [Candidatus Methylacidiphilales bacterium]|nr:aminotransferase class I/II-fold pyridoxal phosphate-dependent enzyme [Candidatus Methylacidiphilales bacterium]